MPEAGTRSVRAAQAGFTLIEIMVVIVILGLLATMVAQNATNGADQARLQRAAVDTKQIADAARMFYAEKGRVPELADLTTPDERGRVYLETIPKDPWDVDYVMREGETPRSYLVVSAGPNRQLGDDDDISSKLTVR
ncbi:MAG TPA: type II secretion system protein GspG [Planctomycetota bacterium]|nr:type II secretion system protein GspG [Planctomycetota bacterium]